MNASHVQTVLDRYAEGTPYAALAEAFLSLERSGDDPVCLLAEAAAATTGQTYETGVRTAVTRFRETFIDTGRVESFADVATLDPEDDGLVDVFSAQRKRHVLLEAAQVFAEESPSPDDLETLQSWAAQADIYRYDEDPIGAIAGVGPTSFQYLRMLAGIDTAKPGPPVRTFFEELVTEDGCADLPIDTTDPLRTIASCEWLASVSSYRMIEIDQLAWWRYTNATDG